MKIFPKESKQKISVFDALLCRMIALAAAGLNYSEELSTARTLASVLEKGGKH